MLFSSGGQALLVPGLALRLIKNFVSLQQDGQADVILIPRLTQSRFVICHSMIQNLILALFIFSLCSCHDSTKSKKIIAKTQSADTTFVPDSFNNRNDTASFNIDKGKLAKKTVTLDVLFGNISCECAQWAEAKYSNDPENRKNFFLEPASPSLINADTLFNGNNFPIRLLVTGQYYSKEGFPKNYRPAKGAADPAKVFRYTKIKILSLGRGI
jgi:hypothetical protein